MLSWEYPPLIEGGLARHVRKLSENLAALGIEVHVLTRGREESPSEEIVDGVHLHRVREPLRPAELGEFITWVEHMNTDMLAAGVELGDRFDFDLVHGHDWLVAGRRRPPRQALARAARDDDPRDRVRAPPGLGRQASAEPHPRDRDLDRQPRRPGDRLLRVHARPRLRHLRDRGRARRGDPERDRPRRPSAVRRGRDARVARAVRAPGREARAARRAARLREGLPDRARGAADA